MTNRRIGPYFTSDSHHGEIPQLLRKARKAADLTQQELANRLGINRSRLAQWETGKRRIPMEDMNEIKEALPGAGDWDIKPQWSSHHGYVARLAIIK